MSATLEFTSARFDVIEGEPTPDNAQRQHALLAWLAERLSALGLTSAVSLQSARGTWYFDATVFAAPYRFQCSAPEPSGGQMGSAWAVRISASRSLLDRVVDRLLGRGELTADDALVRIVLELLERQADFTHVKLTM